MMHRMRFTGPALVLAALTAGAGAAGAQSDLRSRLLALDNDLARLRLGALAARLTPDGVLLWPGAPVASGPKDVRRLLEAQRVLDSVRVTWQPLGIEVASDSTLALIWGVAAVTRGSGDPALGRYLAVWNRGNEGWKVNAFALIGLPLTYTEVPDGLPARTPIGPAGPAGGVIAADIAFARLAADSGAPLAFERWAAADAVLPGGLLVRGPREIGRAIRTGNAWRWYPVQAGTSASGEMGFTVGLATITPPEGRPAHSKYLTVWRRQPDGRIRFIIDGGNNRPEHP